MQQVGSPLLKACRCFSAELNLMCVDSVVKISGRMHAPLPEQQQSMESWRQDLLASPHRFSVDGRVLETSPECIAQRSTPVSSQSSCEWEQSWARGSASSTSRAGLARLVLLLTQSCLLTLMGVWEGGNGGWLLCSKG